MIQTQTQPSPINGGEKLLVPDNSLSIEEQKLLELANSLAADGEKLLKNLAHGQAINERTLLIPGATLQQNKDYTEVGKYAVDEYNKKTGAGLEFKSVPFGYDISYARVTVYLLVIYAADKAGTHMYGAIVTEIDLIFYKKRALVYFAKIKN